MRRKTEEVVMSELRDAETAEDIFLALDRLSGRDKTAQSEALVSAAGTMLANRFDDDTDWSNNE